MKRFVARFKSLFLPCLAYPALLGFIVGTVTFFFKYGAHFILDITPEMYDFIRNNPLHLLWFFPLIISLSLISYFLTKFCVYAKGGGIPNSLGSMRGEINYPWFKTLITTILSSFITFFSGAPLGNEGPSVQIGTTIGNGISKINNKSEHVYNRYMNTGGAAAGFAVATNAPLSGILFVLEEGHKRLSPTIILSSLTTVASATFFARIYEKLLSFESHLVNVSLAKFTLKDVYIPLIVGIISGLASWLFSFLFKKINKSKFLHQSKIPFILKYISFFLLIAIFGILSNAFIGTGNNIVNNVLNGDFIISIMLIIAIIRSLIMLFASDLGVTGGLLIPSLTIGALIGGIIGKTLLLLGVNEDLYTLIIILSMTSFLASTQKIPLTAIVFSIECFSSYHNILYVIIAVFISYLIMECSGVKSLNDIILDSRLNKYNKNKEYAIYETTFVVKNGSFLIGKATRDIFWPPSSLVLSITYPKATTENTVMDKDGERVIKENCILTIRFSTYNLEETLKIFKSIFANNDFTYVKKI